MGQTVDPVQGLYLAILVLSALCDAATTGTSTMEEMTTVEATSYTWKEMPITESNAVEHTSSILVAESATASSTVTTRRVKGTIRGFAHKLRDKILTKIVRGTKASVTRKPKRTYRNSMLLKSGQNANTTAEAISDATSSSLTSQPAQTVAGITNSVQESGGQISTVAEDIIGPIGNPVGEQGGLLRNVMDSAGITPATSTTPGAPITMPTTTDRTSAATSITEAPSITEPGTTIAGTSTSSPPLASVSDSASDMPTAICISVFPLIGFIMY